MKLASLMDEKYGLSRNLGREFGERYLKDFIDAGQFVKLWDEIENQYKDLQPKLQATFEKTNDLLKYIKPEQGDETYRISSLPEAAAQLLNEYLDDVITAINQSLEVKNFDYDTAVEIIEHFDGLFTDMLDIFTSNTHQLSTLDPYKQNKIGFKLAKDKVNEDSSDKEIERLEGILDDKKHDILVAFGRRTFQRQKIELMLRNTADVEDFLVKNNFIPAPKESPFEEQIREVIKREVKKVVKKKTNEDVLGSSEPIGLSKLPNNLAKTSATHGSGKKPDATNVGSGGGNAKSLNPSQKQIILVKAFNKAMNMTPAGGKYQVGGDLGAVVSNDSPPYIMDGHHRWAATILLKPNAPMKGLRIDMPAKDLITALNIYTKGVIGKQSGNPGEGAISQFTGENIQTKIIDVAKKIGRSPDHEDAPGYEWEELKRRISTFGKGSYEKGLNTIKTNAAIISNKKVESWMPNRSDMPIIRKSQLKDVETAFKSGKLDIKPPFDPATKVQMTKAGFGNQEFMFSEPDTTQSSLKEVIKKEIKKLYENK